MKIQSTHDKFFKSTFGNLALAKDFLENYLPETILNQLDLENIELQKDSFITANLQESFSDLIFKTSFAERGLSLLAL